MGECRICWRPIPTQDEVRDVQRGKDWPRMSKCWGSPDCEDIAASDPDPSTYSGAALRGLLSGDACTGEEWEAAQSAGLLVWVPDGQWSGDDGTVETTPRGSRLLAKAQVVADGLSDEDARHLRGLPPTLIETLDSLCDRGLAEWRVSGVGGWCHVLPWGRFVSALYERGRNG